VSLISKMLAPQASSFAPTVPAAPHINGKVERSQAQQIAPSFANRDLSASRADIENSLPVVAVLQPGAHPYGLGVQNTAYRLEELQSLIPSAEAVKAAYDLHKESYVTNSYYVWVKSEET
jgi:hypothetical protein